ncbi:MAG: hypothetical protein M1837_004455 [Sclerophora amabilis]|nr:MAG: hypothetical protein M1837_004455 [Sclerophora amabilis]
MVKRSSTRFSVDPQPATAKTSPPGPGESGYGRPRLRRPNTISVPPAKHGGGGGSQRSIGQTFKTNPANGGMSIALPIHTSSGRAGFGPSLELAYNSGSGNGPFGIGWSLDLGTITRKTSHRIPRYDESDTFLISDTEELVQVSAEDRRHPDGFDIRSYKPRVVVSPMRIERWTNSKDRSDVHWKTISADNVTKIYGRDNASRVTDVTTNGLHRIFSWLLCESYDSFGNLMCLTYKAENSDGIDAQAKEVQVCEAARSDHTRARAKYLKSIRYGNLTPNRNLEDWKVIPYSGKWLFQLVLDYGEHGSEAPTINEEKPWSLREDSFSSYSSGFEVRCHRLCRRLLMFHHFPDELGRTDVLVHSVSLSYHTSPSTSSLVAFTQHGHIVDPQTGEIQTQSMSPYEFEYTGMTLSEDTKLEKLDSTSILGLPGNHGESIQWLDLNGDGSPGLFQELDGNAWSYQRNEKCINADAPEFFGSKTILRAQPNCAMGPAHYFEDVDGDGKLELVCLDGSAKMGGYYQRRDSGWEEFTDFSSVPTMDVNDPSVKRIDLTGNGLRDLLLLDEQTGELVWYECLGEFGFGAEQRIGASDQHPQLITGDENRTVHFADMSGDGKTDVVHISPGRISYWPNLGLGTFGGEIVMYGSPRMDNTPIFSSDRIRLADIDGSGTTDLLYFPSEGGIKVYFNLAGNGWSEEKQISSFPLVGQLTSISIMDLLGNGTSCVCWAGPDATHAAKQDLYYVDLTGGNKSNLLRSYTNGLGAKVEMTYESSNWFYLQDERRGTPWKTKIGFPVQCVTHIVVTDEVAGTRTQSRYEYHEGYYDGTEKEFRGFGMVETWDAEAFNPGKNGGFSRPPVHTKTWYHTGAVDCGLDISTAYSTVSLSPSKLPESMTAVDLPEVYRSLKGRTMRTEIYSDDASDCTTIPYQMTETTYQIHRVQGATKGRPGVYRVSPRETLITHQERSDSEPRRTHNLVLQVDEFNNVLKAASISYGRQKSSLEDQVDRRKQEESVFLFSETDYTNAIDAVDVFRAPARCSSRHFRLIGALKTDLYLTDELEAKNYEYLRGAAVDVLDGSSVSLTIRKVVKFAETRVCYLSSDLAHRLPFGGLEAYSVAEQSYDLVFTQRLLETIYGESFGPQKLSIEATMSDGGYMDINEDGNWWKPSGRSFHAQDQLEELASARRSFYTPTIFHDPFGNQSITKMDHYWLLPKQDIDAIGNTVSAVNNYHHLQPSEVKDTNGNRTRSLLDGFGRVVATASMGKTTESLGDTLDGINPVLSQAIVNSFFESPTRSAAADLLKDAGTRRIYNDLGFFKAKKTDDVRPSAIATISRTSHAQGGSEDGDLLISFSYLDGNAAPLQDVKLATFDSKSETWQLSKWTLKNGKGDPMRTFQPSLSTSHKFQFQANLDSPTTTILYDPLGRPVGTLNADHTFNKSRISSWTQVTYDEGDTVLISKPEEDEDVGPFFATLNIGSYLPTWHSHRFNIDRSLTRDAETSREIEAAKKAEAYSDTPTVVHLDARDQPILQVSDNKTAKISTRFDYDYAGNRTTQIDGLDRVVEKLQYDLLGRVVWRSGMDDGTHWSFMDCMDKVILNWNSGQWSTRTAYDALGRETDKWLSSNGGAETLVKRIQYGEDEHDAAARNLRAKVWRTLDQSGQQTKLEFDFKGNCVRTQTRFAVEYKNLVDWSIGPKLEEESFVSHSKFDALNREYQMTDAGGGTTKRVFDLAGQLNSVAWRSPAHSDWTPFVSKTSYAADGQPLSINYGNGTTMEMEYHKLSRRLTHKKTLGRNKKPLEDMQYTYDPVGRTSCVNDNAQQISYWHNHVVRPAFNYTYDAIGQLVAAEGRQQINGSNGGGQSLQPYKAKSSLVPMGVPGDGRQLCKYLETYKYDDAGNILEMKHGAADDTAVSGWTRRYFYSEPSMIDAKVKCNRLSRTETKQSSEIYRYDENAGRSGCISSVTGYRSFTWDFSDRLRSSSTQLLNDGTPQTTWYVYNSSGTRVRKVTERAAPGENTPTKLKETLYLGNHQIYRKYKGNGMTLKREMYSSHIMGSGRVAIIETTKDNPVQPLVRYQMGQNLELDDNGGIVSYEEHSPFGATTFMLHRSNTEASKKYRYAGYERDKETGLSYCQARYYAPWLGRWISPDPIGTADGLNLYCYVGNDPVNFIDSTGTGAIEILKRLFKVGKNDNKVVPLPQGQGPSQDDHSPKIPRAATFTKEGEKEAYLKPIRDFYNNTDIYTLHNLRNEGLGIGAREHEKILHSPTSGWGKMEIQSKMSRVKHNVLSNLHSDHVDATTFPLEYHEHLKKKGGDTWELQKKSKSNPKPLPRFRKRQIESLVAYADRHFSDLSKQERSTESLLTDDMHRLGEMNPAQFQRHDDWVSHGSIMKQLELPARKAASQMRLKELGIKINPKTGDITEKSRKKGDEDDVFKIDLPDEKKLSQGITGETPQDFIQKIINFF